MKKFLCRLLLAAMALLLCSSLAMAVSAKTISGAFPFDELDPEKYTYNVSGLFGYVKDSDIPKGMDNMVGVNFYLDKYVVDEAGNKSSEYCGNGYVYVLTPTPKQVSREYMNSLCDFSYSIDLHILQEDETMETLIQKAIADSEEVGRHLSRTGNELSYCWVAEPESVSSAWTTAEGIYHYFAEVPEVPGLVMEYWFSLKQGRENYSEENFNTAMSQIHYFVETGYVLQWDDTQIYDDDMMIVNVHSDASANAGDSDYTVPVAIVVGLASAAAAIGAGLSAGGAGADANKTKKQYKMVVSKAFGDSVRRGANPVTVKARMVETVGGASTERKDLTQLITATASNGLELKSAEFDGKNLVAVIYAQSDTPLEIGTLTFAFSGEGGFFNNIIDFKIIDKAWIDFPENSSTAYSETRFDVIAGDRETYRMQFRFVNAVSEPTSIVFEPGDDFQISYEPAEYERTFYALIKNLTAPIENEPFKKPENKTVKITATFENDDTVEGYFYITVNPEGLSIITYNPVEENRLVIDASEEAEATEFSYAMKPVPFIISFAKTEMKNGFATAGFANVKELNPTFEKLTGDADYAETFSDAFKYHIDGKRSDEGQFDFVPEIVVTNPVGDPYRMDMVVNCSYDGITSSMKLPLVIKGQTPPSKPSDWDKEFERLKKDIMFFGLNSNSPAREMIRVAKNYTADELMMIRRAIIIEATSYYRKEASDMMRLDEVLGRYEFICAGYKWIADQAFSYMVTTYFGGPYVEAFATPLKDLLGQFLGELTASAYWQEGGVKTSGNDFWMSIYTGAENAVSNYMGDAMGENPVSLKKIGGVCAGFMFLSFLRRYAGWSDDGKYKGDLYNSLINAFGDLTTNVFKNLMSNYLGKVLTKNSPMCKTVEKWLSHGVGDAVKKMKSTEIVAKYLSESFGLVVSNVYSNLSSDYKDVVNDDGTFTLTLTIGESEIKINPIASLQGITDIAMKALIQPIAEHCTAPLADGCCPKYYKTQE